MRKTLLLLAVSAISVSSLSAAQSLVIQVENIQENEGQIGCALYDKAEGFPMEQTQITQLWLDANTDGIQCEFGDLAPGVYAVAVSHDMNGNQIVDTGLFGIPKEAWGVTNNIRPTFRAPTFEEAAIELAEDAVLTVSIDQ